MDWFLYDRDLFHEKLILLCIIGFVLNYFLYCLCIASHFLSYSVFIKSITQISLDFVKAIRYMLTSTSMVQNLRMPN